MVSLTKPLRKLTPVSSTTCTLPGLRTLRLRVARSVAIIQTAMMIQLTTTEPATGMPPNTGMVKAVSFCIASSRVCLKPSNLFTSFSTPVYSRARGVATLL